MARAQRSLLPPSSSPHPPPNALYRPGRSIRCGLAFSPAGPSFLLLPGPATYGLSSLCIERAAWARSSSPPSNPRSKAFHSDSWRNNRGDKSGITRDEPGHTGKTLCNFIAWDENRRGGKSLPFSSLLDGVRVWPESLFRLSTHHGSGSVGGVLPHLGKPTVGPLAVVFFHR